MTNEEQTISNLKKLKSFHNGSYGSDIDRAIKALKSETVTEFADRCRECGKNRWIPVSDRPPEESGRYLAYIVNRHDDKLHYIMTCNYSADGYWNWFPDDECASDNVVAWMPLPEEYKLPKSEE